MKGIVGLGNPGSEYETTRHNAGKIVLDWIAEEWKGSVGERVSIASKPAWLIFPDMFMNKSGPALVSFLKKHDLTIPPKDLLVIHDDLDIAIGSTKLTINRGSGGHKGVDSLFRALKTKHIWRLRVGVEPRTPAQKKKTQKEGGKEYLLAPFAPTEKKLLTEQRETILSGVASWMESPEKAMNILNKK